MFTKILVALDRSSMNKQVIAAAIALAKTMNARVMLLHALSPEEEGSPDITMMNDGGFYSGLNSEILDMHRQQWQEFENQGSALLQAFTKEATAAGVPTEFQQIFGPPSRVICKSAKDWGAELIILGRRGHAGLKEVFLGSVSNYVLHHAPCSVLTIQAVNKANTQSMQTQQAVVS